MERQASDANLPNEGLWLQFLETHWLLVLAVLVLILIILALAVRLRLLSVYHPVDKESVVKDIRERRKKAKPGGKIDITATTLSDLAAFYVCIDT